MSLRKGRHKLNKYAHRIGGHTNQKGGSMEKVLTIAEMIYANAVSVTHAVESSDLDEFEEEQDYEHEKTTFEFSDGSRLVFQNDEMWVEE